MLTTRREVLGALAAASALNADPRGLPIGVQLYTVGAEIRRDRDATLKQIAAIGYKDVQLATGLANDSRELVKAIRDAGLGCRSTHYSLVELLKGLDEKIAMAHEAKLESVFCSFPWVRDAVRLNLTGGDQLAAAKAVFTSMTLDDWRWTADELNRIGGQMKKAGLLFGYHNHNLDFRKFGETLAFDELLRRTEAGLVKIELDCGWATVAGVDPAALIARDPARYPLLHVKDQKPQTSPATGMDGFARSTEVGAGIVNWKKVFAAAKGLKGYYVEQEPPFTRPALESIAISYRYLHGLS